ncbi:PAS/PAC sensor hybrid histidine kinase [Caballeronia choica]|uniref:histidine kinase n=1 Tax=Caballeronia choica TaxID=326476 RepID=A0A158L4N6_9BURK|nr:PAS/PAC sensor hybrid histidine kinase [Caballeronia choica]
MSKCAEREHRLDGAILGCPRSLSEVPDLRPVGNCFEQAACGLLIAEINGTILRVNPVFCHWLGYDLHELVGVRKVSDLLTVGGKLFQQTHWGPLLEIQRSVAELKLEILSRDRRRIPMLLNVRRVESGSDAFDHFAFMILSDRHKFEQELVKARNNAERALQARRGVEEELRRADRQKDEFLATLAHELRNPLAPMRSVVDLLRAEGLDGGAGRVGVRRARSAIGPAVTSCGRSPRCRALQRGKN